MHGNGELIADDEYALLRGLVEREFGINLKPDKKLTFHMKVAHRLDILGLRSYSEYYDLLAGDAARGELRTLASHLTNNETYFLREKGQLDFFASILRDVKTDQLSRDERVLRVLSVASSTGEEAYTLNAIIQESGLFVWDWDCRIVGIDIDKEAIRRAREGCYGKNSFRAVNGDRKFIEKYFTEQHQDRYMLRPALKRNVEFREGNLVEKSVFSEIGPVDVIFCRNVLIYMSEHGIQRAVGNFYDCLKDTGYLFIGTSESLIQATDMFRPQYSGGTIVYRKNLGHDG